MTFQPVLLEVSRRLLAATALMAILGGCAAPKMQVTPGTDTWNGRLALKVDSTPPQSFTAGFDLHGTPQSGELLLATPLGSTLATITWGPDFAQMTQGNQVTRRNSLAELSADMGGTEVPVAALFSWLKGNPIPVDGWQADLSRHAEGRITAKRSSPLPEAELRLVVEP
jgi:outer membrane lipoprotein LolB